jgi:hypothetical protein
LASESADLGDESTRAVVHGFDALFGGATFLFHDGSSLLIS